ncbi:MAG: hypothetical protein P1P84_07150 [Deferrisomatales bacterium]|nr:hypothetical protein [Deferrisomatales bacterium]
MADDRNRRGRVQDGSPKPPEGIQIGANWKFIGTILLFVAIYIALSTSTALPYRFFPSDDRSFLSPGYAHLPFYQLSLYCIYLIYEVFQDQSVSYQTALVMHCALSNSLTITIIAIMLYQFTGSFLTSFLACIVFATSSWHSVYYFMASYASFSAMLTLLSVKLLHTATRADRGFVFLVALFGIVGGLLFLSSSSPLLVIFLQCLTLFFLYVRYPKGRGF